MPRTIPDFRPEFKVGAPQQDGWHTLSQEIEQLTPMMGGGWLPLVTEALDPVRIQAIRGHLRFWWRATRSAHYTSTKEMLRHEVLLWGSTDLPSAVQVRVEVLDPGRLTQLPFKDDASCVPPYVGFPMPNSKDKDTGQMPQGGFLWEGMRFNLVLNFPAQLTEKGQFGKGKSVPLEELEPKAEVEAALWAWLHFGGLGARTRRGCGALQAVGTAQEATALRKALEAGINLHVREGNGPPEGVASLISVKRQASEHLVITRDENSPAQAWRVLIRQYKDYRQARRQGSMPNRPGRSFWCEPDELRRLTGQSEPGHKTPVNQVRKAPRAAFGLPIVFHFKDKNDPDDHQLQGESHDRLASPLILRPIRVKGGGVGLALRLHHRCDQGLVPSALGFKGRRGLLKVGHQLSANELAQLKGQSNLDKTALKLDHADPVTDFLKQLR